MVTNPESTNQGIHFDRNPSTFPPFGNIGAPYMATLSLPGFTIGLLVWLFSTSLVQNVVISLQSSTPPTGQNQPPFDPNVDPLPSSSVISSSPSSSSPSESIGTSNQVAKKKKKGKKKKKKKVQQRENQATIGLKATSDEKPSIKPHKVRYPCKICEGYHLLRSCLDIPQILEEWYSYSHHPVSSTSRDHVGDTPSTSGSKFHGKKGKIKFPCRLCEGNHPIHLCPYLEEAKRVLDNHLASPQRLPSGYRKLSRNPSLVDELTDQNQSSVKPTLFENESYESIPDPNQ